MRLDAGKLLACAGRMAPLDRPSPVPPEIGQRPPALTWTGALGQSVSLESLRGAPVLLVFFARAHTGRLDPDAPETTSHGALLPAGARPIGGGGADFWFELDDGARERMTCVHDASSLDGAAARLYGVPGMNAAFLVDAGGVVCWRQITPPRASFSMASVLAAADAAIKPARSTATSLAIQ